MSEERVNWGEGELEESALAKTRKDSETRSSEQTVRGLRVFFGGNQGDGDAEQDDEAVKCLRASW